MARFREEVGGDGHESTIGVAACERWSGIL